MDPNMYNGQGRTPLHLCTGASATHITVEARNAVATYLADHGGWVEAPDYDGRTPLLVASIHGRPAVGKALLDRGADLAARDHEGSTALQLSASHEHPSMVKYLIERGAPVDEVGADGCTPLHESVGRSNVEIARVLIGSGATVDSADDDGCTPLMYAVANDDQPMATLLLEAGASVDVRDAQGRTPLLVAAEAGHAASIALLIECDAEIDAADADGDTALHVATGLGHRSAMESLLSHGADVAATNVDGDQAAHVACRGGDVEAVQLLVEYDAPMGRRNWAELTPIGVARMHAKADIAGLLMDALAPEALGLWEGDGEAPEPPNWDAPIAQLAHGWEQMWDADEQRQYWLSTETGEIRTRMPVLEGGSAVDVVALRDRRVEPQFRRKTQKIVGESLLGVEEYRAFHEQMSSETNELRGQWKAATILQAYWRRKYARELTDFRRERRDAARKIQRGTRARARRTKDAATEARRHAATLFATAYRGHNQRHFFHEFLAERLWWRRAERLLATKLQRLWRANVARRGLRRLRLIRSREWTHGAWQPILRKCFPPKRSWGVYDEHIFPGMRDVRFYAHKLTDSCFWDQPEDWVAADYAAYLEREQLRTQGFTKEEKHAATIMQARWRTRCMRRDFQLVLKGAKIMKSCEELYLERPDDVVSLCNYALYLHTITHDYDRCRLVYSQAVKRMGERGPDNAFVMFSYAIFLALTGSGSSSCRFVASSCR